MATKTTSKTASAKKSVNNKNDHNILALQSAIVHGLEDVKAVDIRVFDTEHLSSLFERVMVASGNSNRQTRALAMSVLESVRKAGFAKPRIEGQDNGEWIIVDCGMAVVHIMQPSIRSYYNLEEIWGEKAVDVKKAAKTVSKTAAKTALKKEHAEEKAASASKKTPAKKAPSKKAAIASVASKAPAKKTASKKVASKTLASSAPAKKSAAKNATVKKVVAKKTATKKSVTRK